MCAAVVRFSLVGILSGRDSGGDSGRVGWLLGRSPAALSKALLCDNMMGWLAACTIN